MWLKTTNLICPVWGSEYSTILTWLGWKVLFSAIRWIQRDQNNPRMENNRKKYFSYLMKQGQSVMSYNKVTQRLVESNNHTVRLREISISVLRRTVSSEEAEASSHAVVWISLPGVRCACPHCSYMGSPHISTLVAVTPVMRCAATSCRKGGLFSSFHDGCLYWPPISIWILWCFVSKNGRDGGNLN